MWLSLVVVYPIEADVGMLGVGSANEGTKQVFDRRFAIDLLAS